MKRYTNDTLAVGGFGLSERQNGEWVKFTDHQAEIANLKNLLKECWIVLFYAIASPHEKEEELAERVEKAIAKDSNV